MALRIKLLLPLIMLMAIFSLILHLFWIPEYRAHEYDSLSRQEQTNLAVLGTSLVPSLLTSDLARIYGTLDDLLEKNELWKRIYLQNPEGLFLYPFGVKEEQYNQTKYSRIRQAVTHEGRVLAYLEVDVDIASELSRSIAKVQSLEFIMLLNLFVITMLAAFFQDRWVRSPLKLLAQAAGRFSKGDFDQVLPRSSGDEVGQLISAFDSMRHELEQRDSSLQRQHLQLKAISQLLSGYVTGEEKSKLFKQLLDQTLVMTHSECGVIGELFDKGATSYVEYARACRQEDSAVAQWLENNCEQLVAEQRKVCRPLDCISASLVETEEGVSPENYLSIPFCHGEKMLGVMILVNRPEGFGEGLIHCLEPIISTCVNVMDAIKSARVREQAKRDLRERGTRMSTVLDNIVDGIITIDEYGVIESFNAAAERIFGYPSADVLGKNVKMLMPSEEAETHDDHLEAFRARGYGKILGKSHEFEGMRANGERFPIDLAINEMWLGNKRLFCGIVRDITERKKVDKLKSEFISTVSHELRTPLTSIRGSLGLLVGGVMGEFSGQVEMLLDTANRNTERLLLLIDDMLDIEKLEQGEMSFKMEPIDVDVFLRQAVEVNQGYANEHNVSLSRVAEDEGMDAEVVADWGRLQQVMSNLISNAIKFSPEQGEVKVGVKREDGEICISVADHGPGIPEEFQLKMFEKFTQSDASDARKVGGTGLGLSIVKAIVERHGGVIHFETEPGVGTTFYVCLPEVTGKG